MVLTAKPELPSQSALVVRSEQSDIDAAVFESSIGEPEVWAASYELTEHALFPHLNVADRDRRVTISSIEAIKIALATVMAIDKNKIWVCMCFVL